MGEKRPLVFSQLTGTQMVDIDAGLLGDQALD
jgi:hypothetical protein